jgi:hypothetical protein
LKSGFLIIRRNTKSNYNINSDSMSLIPTFLKGVAAQSADGGFAVVGGVNQLNLYLLFI